HVQEVSPGFSPVFPGMGGGISADITFLPIWRSTRLIIFLKRPTIIGGFIAKQLAIVVEKAGAGHETIPVIVTDFVAKMTKQGAIRLSHFVPHFFACGIVGFGDVQSDDALVMACHYFRYRPVWIYLVS